MWCELQQDVADEFSCEVFDLAGMRWGGGFHYVVRKGRKAAKEDRSADKQEAQVKYRASLLTNEQKREKRLAAKRACAKAAYHRMAA